MFGNLLSIRLLLSVLVFSAFLSTSSQISAAEETQAQPASSTDIPQTITPKFNVELEALEKMNDANESYWLDIGEQKTLVLKYWARGKVSRGHLILLHAQGEHADHPRIMKPLARQFSEQGWHVYLPNLPVADYPNNKVLSDNEKSDISPESEANQQQDPAQNPASSNAQLEQAPKDSVPTTMQFFSDETAYQLLINQTIEQLISTIQPELNNLLVLANQNSGYWILDSLKTLPAISQVVLLEPQIPMDIDKNLESSFNGQNLPVFTFVENSEIPSDFIVAFDRQLWRSPFQRINRGTFSNQGIEMEDTRISKLISGWVSRQQKQK